MQLNCRMLRDQSKSDRVTFATRTEHPLHDVGFVFEHGRLVAIHIEVVGSAEDRHDRRETGGLGLAVHSISIGQELTLAYEAKVELQSSLPSVLSLMSSDDGQQPVSLQKLTSRRVSVSPRSRSGPSESKANCTVRASHSREKV